MQYVLIVASCLVFGGLAGWVLRGWNAAHCLECDDELPLLHSWTRTHRACRQAPPVPGVFVREVMAAVADSGPGTARLP